MARHFPVGHLLWLHLHEGSVEQTAVVLPARGGNVEGPRKEIHRLQRGKKEKHKETSYFTPTMLIFGQAWSANKSSPSSTFTCTAQRQLQMAKLPLPFSTGILFLEEPALALQQRHLNTGSLTWALLKQTVLGRAGTFCVISSSTISRARDFRTFLMGLLRNWGTQKQALCESTW